MKVLLIIAEYLLDVCNESPSGYTKLQDDALTGAPAIGVSCARFAKTVFTGVQI